MSHPNHDFNIFAANRGIRQECTSIVRSKQPRVARTIGSTMVHVLPGTEISKGEMMSVMQNILDAISQRIAAIVGGAVASRVDTMAVLEQVHQQDALEERARQLEKEGKTELAESLRRRMLQTDHDNPGAQGQVVLARLCSETPPEGGPALLEDESRQSAAAPKRRKRATRRVASQPQSPEETGDEQ